MGSFLQHYEDLLFKVKDNGFMGCISDYQQALVVLIGVPLDATVSFRPGTRFAPAKIRQMSVVLEEYSPVLNKELTECPFYDAGDIILPFGQVEESLVRIETVVDGVLADGKFPLIIGGEHLVTLPVVRALFRYYPDLVVVQLDAHADLRDEYLGQKFSHATVIRRVVEVVGGKNVFQLGVRSGTREEFSYGRRKTRFFPGEVLPFLARVQEELKGRPVYLTIDIDVLDPAFAPGTGTPEPGGCLPGELFSALYQIAELEVVGMDLVEVCPVYDPAESTSLLAAKIIREAILSFAPSKK